ncbi:MAG: hypothetical protein N2513_03230 [Deltaproteobacteria bacterium]|nr:hypothetical protein [Deltaproteobacteria bacterium]
MLLITHHTGENHGLLGPQIVATYISEKLKIPTIVLGLKRGFKEEEFFKFLDEHYRRREKVVLFSYHCGRPDILELAEKIKTKGYRTILGGPQVEKDISGEPDLRNYPERIKGFSHIFDLGYIGPIDGMTEEILKEKRGLFYGNWRRDIEVRVEWDNLFVFGDKIEKIQVREAQVLRSIGCPYASKKEKLLIDAPSFLFNAEPIEIECEGCSFCDVAWDKGYRGNLADEKILEQIENLPTINGRKIPFELIDEYPIVYLPRLLELVFTSDINVSQINLVLRVDDILRRKQTLEHCLVEMKKRGLRLFISSVGFESFSDKILKNLNKGVKVSENLETIRILRELKGKFRETVFYSRDEGAVHGFIHPTPWDDPNTIFEIQSVIGSYGLFHDILPCHSTPLIIHHGCALGEWARKIELKYNIRFSRRVNIIEWWDYKKVFR